MNISKLEDLKQIEEKLRLEDKSYGIPKSVEFYSNGNICIEYDNTKNVQRQSDESKKKGSDTITMVFLRQVLKEMGKDLVEEAIKRRDEYKENLIAEAKAWALEFATGAKVKFESKEK